MMDRRSFFGALIGAVGLGALAPARTPASERRVLIHYANTEDDREMIVTMIRVEREGLEYTLMERAGYERSATWDQGWRPRDAIAVPGVGVVERSTPLARWAFVSARSLGWGIGQVIYVTPDGFVRERA